MSLPVTIEGKTSEIYKPHSTKRHMLGTRLAFPDGRVFRYAKCAAGAAITIGRIVGQAAPQATLYRDCVASGSQARTTAQWDDGTNYIYTCVTASASTSLHAYANRFDDGYLWVNDEAGEGQMLQIKSHAVSTSAGSTALKVTIYDEDLLTIALTTASQMGLVANLYNDVVIHLGDTGGGPALGVAPVAVAASKYFWLQTWGPCPVMSGKIAMLAGQEVLAPMTSGDTAQAVAGSVYPAYSTDAAFTLTGAHSAIGNCIVPATGDAEYALIYLTIAP